MIEHLATAAQQTGSEIMGPWTTSAAAVVSFSTMVTTWLIRRPATKPAPTAGARGPDISEYVNKDLCEARLKGLQAEITNNRERSDDQHRDLKSWIEDLKKDQREGVNDLHKQMDGLSAMIRQLTSTIGDE